MKRLIIFLAALPIVLLAGSLPPHQLAAFFGPSEAVSSGYTPETAGFDGASDYLTMNGVPTGFADSKSGTVAVWLDFTGGDGVEQTIIWTTGARFVVAKNSDNKFYIYGGDSGGEKMWVVSSVTKVAADGWFHLMVVWDLSGGTQSNCKFYFDGVEDASKTFNTYTDATLDLDIGGTPSRRIGAGDSAGNKLFASIADFWLANFYNNVPGDYISGGNPVDLGADGSTPTGAKPGFYFSRNGSGDSWNFDSANGNSFTLTGALGSPAPP